MNVIKRSGEEVVFDASKIENAIKKANKATTHNQMTDDVKIILREYRLALKKNNNKRKDAFRDKIEENIENNKKSRNE